MKEVRVTPVQYARLADAVNNWPKNLGRVNREKSTRHGPKYCTVGFLQSRATVDVYDGDEKISEFYGIPITHLNWSMFQNDFLPFPLPFPFDERIRSWVMRRRYKQFLNKVKVVPEPLERSDAYTEREVYTTR